MVRFAVEIEIEAPPKFVVDWWWDYSPQDASIAPGMVRRDVEKVDENTVRLTTHSEFGGNIRTTMGTVTRTGPTSWHMSAHVSSGGKVVSTVQTEYVVEPTATGSHLSTHFDFRGITIPWRIALVLSKFSLRRDRLRTFRVYAQAIEQDFAQGASPAPGAAGSPARSAPPAPPPPS
ncbi:MAG: hypothetical protein WB947_04800 [Thermoplasmata archaeon]